MVEISYFLSNNIGLRLYQIILRRMFMSLNYNPQPQCGPAYGQKPFAASKIVSWLTPEQIASLRKSMPEFTLTIPAEEYVRAQCNHVDSNGNFVAVPTADDEYRCTICGAKFSVNPINDQDINKAVKIVSDALELSKLAYGNCPDNAKEFFAMIPLLKKIQGLYSIAINNLDKLANANSFAINNTYQSQGLSPEMLSAVTGTTYSQPQIFAQPQQQFGYCQSQPTCGPNVMYYQPQYSPNPMYGQQPVAPQYGNPMYGQQPVAPQYSPNPMYGQQPVAPAQPQQQQSTADHNEAQAQQQPVKVNTAFKK